MPRLSIIAVVSVLALGACQAASEPAESPASPSPEPTAAPSQPTEIASPSLIAGPSEAAGDECGAGKVSGRWLNALPTDDVKADIAAKVGDRPIRYYTQGDPITMDFSAARLNVESGPDGRIKLFRCG